MTLSLCNMKLGQMLNEGAGHQIYENPDNPGELIKVPKNNHFSYERVAADIAICRERFSEWLPNSEVEKDDEHGYLTRQEKILDAEHITPRHLEIENIRRQIEAIMQANRQSLDKDGIGIDFIGLEGSTKCAFTNAKKHKGKLVDKLIITPILKFFRWLKTVKKNLPVLDNALELWNSNDFEPEISNLILGRRKDLEKQVFLIDLSLVHTKSKSIKERIRSYVLQRWNRFFLRKQFKIDI